MDFFKSVFSDEPEPLRSSDSDPDDPSEDQYRSTEPEPPCAWSFGGLIRTLAIQSESVIETYRRDLQEFTTGLKKEIEVAQGSLETMMNSTAQIISQGKESILSVDLDTTKSNQASAQNRYSRFDSQVRAVQCDARTYTEEPEDSSDYKNWKSGFGIVLKEKIEEEIDGLFGENGAMERIYKNVVPGCVDHETFWLRYFYKVHRLKKNEELRAKLVRRAISSGDDDDEELSWDVDDDDDENDGENSEMGKKSPGDFYGHDDEDENSRVDDQNVGGSSNGRESIRGIGDSLALSQRLMVREEEEVEWDEIEDLSSIDDDGNRIAATRSRSPNRTDLRKRLSSAEEEEDLSWDIEGDDD